ncbi:hypothetical protein [Amycolatopsis alkalitolerans]|uniref:PH domain-containing protein n=1 Tax=Amycolatopsis alkalitolerans TaxID=2547244 RepID=A0A5C4LX36_9PSEU|nr:hypothetical protein [Amycolatopsis alkalitolerans]TNC24116.1 hypothetical protein FG385_18790 [Amycolatopsis alkalitolerans]
MHVLAKTPGSGDIITVLYRKGERIFGIVCLVASLGFMFTIITPLEDREDNFGTVAGVILVVTPALWLLIAVLMARVVIRTDGIYVRNWFFSWWITWTAIDELDVDDHLVVVLSNGFRIYPSVGGGSVASALRGNRHLRGLRDQIEQARREATSGMEPVAYQRRRFGIWRFILIYAIFIGLAALVRL